MVTHNCTGPCTIDTIILPSYLTIVIQHLTKSADPSVVIPCLPHIASHLVFRTYPPPFLPFASHITSPLQNLQLLFSFPFPSKSPIITIDNGFRCCAHRPVPSQRPRHRPPSDNEDPTMIAIKPKPHDSTAVARSYEQGRSVVM